MIKNPDTGKLSGKQTAKKAKGFSLIEILIAVFIFSLIMTATTQVFTGLIKGYFKTKKVQRDLENAQFASSLLTKSLRTSVLIKCDGAASCAGGSHASLQVYDYSQKKCIIYQISGNNLKIGSEDYSVGHDTDPAGDCAAKTFIASEMFSMASDISSDSGKFYVVPYSASAPKEVGKVTLALKICPGAVCGGGSTSDEADIQSTVSLRNYQEVAP